MDLNDFLVGLSLSDKDKQIVTKFVSDIQEIDDLDEKMDFVDESTFYFDMDNPDVSDEILDYIKDTFV